METTESMTLDQAVEAMVQPEEQAEMELDASEDLSSEEEVDSEEEQPETDSLDDEEADDEDDEASDDDDSDVEDNDDNDVDDDDSEATTDKLYTVKVDGAEQKVTLEELKKGYSGQKYVQLGMQKAAESRKEAEVVYSALMQERQNLANIVDRVAQGALTPPAEPDRSIFDSDPIGYMEARMDYDERLKTYTAQMQQVQEQLYRQSAAESEAQQRYVQGETKTLIEKMPELSDPKKVEAFQNRIQRASEQFGYSPEEVAAINSHRDMMVLDAAAKYLALKDGKEIVREKSKKARQPIKPGAKKVASKKQAVQKQYDKLRRSGSLDDAMALILDPDLMR